MAPKCSRTVIPVIRNAAATAADTSSSSVGRMRGPASNSCTCEPNALKIDATCAPVAPAPTTIIEAGISARSHASLCVEVNSKPEIGSPRLTPPAHKINLSASNRSPFAVCEVVRLAKMDGAGSLPHGYPGAVDPFAKRRTRSHLVNDFPHAREKPRVIQYRLIDDDPVASELPRVPHRSGGVSQRRTGSGASFAAKPPNAPRISSVVRAPNSAARSTADTLAGPAPMMMTRCIILSGAACCSQASALDGYITTPPFEAFDADRPDDAQRRRDRPRAKRTPPAHRAVQAESSTTGFAFLVRSPRRNICGRVAS